MFLLQGGNMGKVYSVFIGLFWFSCVLMIRVYLLSELVVGFS
jgi:hypothetical protein